MPLTPVVNRCIPEIVKTAVSVAGEMLVNGSRENVTLKVSMFILPFSPMLVVHIVKRAWAVWHLSCRR